jgi:hypothetical protein
MPADERDRLWERTKGICEWCGKGMRRSDMDAHHRLTRRHGGWELSNVVGVHHDCHVLQPESIHQNPRLARRKGFIRSRYEEPDPASKGLRATPIIEMWDGLWELKDDGTKEPVEVPF